LTLSELVVDLGKQLALFDHLAFHHIDASQQAGLAGRNIDVIDQMDGAILQVDVILSRSEFVGTAGIGKLDGGWTDNRLAWGNRGPRLLGHEERSSQACGRNRTGEQEAGCAESDHLRMAFEKNTLKAMVGNYS
jgi:hypothetical protein